MKMIAVNHTDWHQWFAWRPVNVNGATVFLKKVWRRKTEAGTWAFAFDVPSLHELEPAEYERRMNKMWHDASS